MQSSIISYFHFRFTAACKLISVMFSSRHRGCPCWLW